MTPGQLWHALDDDEVVGRAYLRRRPDARAYLAADAWLEDVAAELLAAAIADVPGDLHATADENDAAQLALLGRAGFTELRREDEYLLPVRAVEGTAPAGWRSCPPPTSTSSGWPGWTSGCARTCPARTAG